jgi:hypothetical protein
VVDLGWFVGVLLLWTGEEIIGSLLALSTKHASYRFMMLSVAGHLKNV